MTKNKDDRPSLWIYYHARFRSPSTTDRNKWMKQNSKLFKTELITDTPLGVKPQYVCDRRGIEPPNIVLDCFGGYTGVVNNRKWFKDNNVKIVRTVADVEVHKGDFGGGHPKHNTFLEPDALYFPVAPDCHPPIRRLMEYTEDLPAHEQAKLICIPFGVDTEKYKPAKNKDLDLLVMWMAEKGNMFHSNRLRMEKISMEWCKWWNQNTIQCLQSGLAGKSKEDLTDEDKEFLGKFGGKHPLRYWQELNFYDYARKLSKARVMLVDTSMRHYMTNKYLEAGAAGCAMVGEMPYGDTYNKLFYKAMFEIDPDHIETEIPETFEYIFGTEHGREEIRKRTTLMRKRIEENYTIEHWSDRLEKAFMELL